MAEKLALINELIAEFGESFTLGEAKTWAETLVNAEDLRSEDHEE